MSEGSDNSGAIFFGALVIIMIIFFISLSVSIKDIDKHITKLEKTVAEVCVKK